jgi:hypothetical protein
MPEAWDFGVEDYRDPEPEPLYADDGSDSECQGPLTPAFCEDCRTLTMHGDWWENREPYPLRVGFGCSVCRRIVPGR